MRGAHPFTESTHGFSESTHHPPTESTHAARFSISLDRNISSQAIFVRCWPQQFQFGIAQETSWHTIRMPACNGWCYIISGHLHLVDYFWLPIVDLVFLVDYFYSIMLGGLLLVFAFIVAYLWLMISGWQCLVNKRFGSPPPPKCVTGVGRVPLCNPSIGCVCDCSFNYIHKT